MNIYWLVFQDLVELVERGGMHELVYEFLMDIAEIEIGIGRLPNEALDLLLKLENSRLL